MAGVDHLVGEMAIVGYEDEPLALFIEASDCEEPLFRIGKKIEDDRLTPRPYAGANIALWFVQHIVNFLFLAADGGSVDGDLSFSQFTSVWGILMVSPLTWTRPSKINSSQALREATPAAANALLNLSFP